MPKKITTDEVIKRFKDVHGNRYDYSLVKYKNKIGKVKIICKEHGIFEQGAGAHWYGSNCPKCLGRSLNTEDTIKRFKDVHGNKYDYSLVKYESAYNKVKIICKEHGDFKQTPNAHWSGSNCPDCANDIISNKNSDADKIISCFKDVHGSDRYDYSLVKYKNKRSIIKVICKKHGEFKINAQSHKLGKGCDVCEIEEKEKKMIENFKNVHMDRYDYSLVKYNGKHNKVKIICKEHGIFEQSPNQHQFRLTNCPECAISEADNTSELENIIIDILHKNNIKYIQSDRKLIAPLELDILIPDSNIAIECNGHYWHSSLFRTNNYHINKTIQCNQNNIQLLHFWENEINTKLDIVSSIVLSKIGYSKNKIYARKCKIKEISDTSISKEFENLNHLQGSTGSSLKLGLYYNDELVSLMTFGKPRFNKNYDWELIRFCSKLNTNVIGGASKLFTYFIRNYLNNGCKVISYANRRISDGNLYKILGFTELTPSQPSYFYYGKSKIYKRYQCQKHKLENLLGENNFDENLTEEQNMNNNGYHRVYDCGNLVFEYNKGNINE